MAIQFFGQYLLARGIIDGPQLLEAVDFQESQNLKLGEIAVKHGYMTKPDADRVNRLQQTKDVRFGDGAIELGLLTGERVDELLLEQRNSHRYLGDVIIEKRFAAQDTIAGALEKFKAEQQSYEQGTIRIPDDIVEADLARNLFALTHKLVLRVWGVHSKLGSASVADTQPVLPGISAEVGFSGDVNARYLLGVPSRVAGEGAKHVLEVNESTPEEQQDLVCELANVVCGNMVALLGRQGRQTEISPPQKVTAQPALVGQKSVSMTVVTPFGDMITAVVC